MDCWVQGLDPAIQGLGKACDLAHLAHSNACRNCHALLGYNGSCVDACVNYVDGASGFRSAGGKSIANRVSTRILRQQGWVKVDNPWVVPVDKALWKHSHKSSKNNEVRLVDVDVARENLGPLVLGSETAGLDHKGCLVE